MKCIKLNFNIELLLSEESAKTKNTINFLLNTNVIPILIY